MAVAPDAGMRRPVPDIAVSNNQRTCPFRNGKRFAIAAPEGSKIFDLPVAPLKSMKNAVSGVISSDHDTALANPIGSFERIRCLVRPNTEVLKFPGIKKGTVR